MRTNSNYWLRSVSSGRLSRRRFVGAVSAAGAGAAGFALVGCGDDDDDGGSTASTPAGGSSPGAGSATSEAAPGTTGTSGAPVRGSRLRFTSSNNTWDTFDVHRSRFTPFAALIGYTNEGILQVNDFANREIGAALAESFEQPDETTMTFTVREGALWHDKPPVNGRAATAEDMAYTLTRNREGKLTDGTDDLTFWRRAALQFVDAIEPVDDGTLRLTFSQPMPTFLNTLADPYMKVVAPEAVAEFESTYRELSADSIIGTGAYVLSKFDPEGEAALDRFEGWTGDAWVDGIDYLALFTDQAAQRTAFEQKQLDTFAPAQPSVLEDLKSRFEGQIQTTNVYSANPQAGTYYGGAEPWNNQNLIGAIFRAFDRRGLVQQLVQGNASISGSIVPSQVAYGFGLTEDELTQLPGYLENHDDDIAEAVRMWEAGGGPDLGTVTVDIPDIYDGLYGAADVIISQLNGALGTSQFQAQVQPYSTINAKIAKQQYGNGNANIWYGWISDVTSFEPTFDLFLNYNSTQPNFQQFGVKIDRVDELTQQAISEFDIDARAQLLKEIETELIKNYGAGVPYNMLTISQPVWWNYYHGEPYVPFVSTHLTATRRWVDSSDPTYEQRS